MNAAVIDGDKRILALDGFRGVAVLVVIVYHLMYSELQDGILGHHLGRFGVEMFFVLSGYLITQLLYKEKASTGKINLRNFFLRRAFKLLPALYTFLAIVLIVFGSKNCSLLSYLPPATFSQEFFRHYDMKMGGHSLACLSLSHTWSLNVEEVFYLIWTPVFTVLTFGRSRIFAFSLIVATGALKVLIHAKTGSSFPAYLWWVPDIAILPDLYAPLLGTWLAMRHINEPHTRCIRPQSWWLVMLPILALTSFEAVSLWVPRGRSFLYYIGILASPLLCLFLLQCILASNQSLYTKISSIPILVWLGRISYSVYLWQQPFTFGRDVDFGQGALGVFFSVAAAIAAGALSFYCIEKPFQILGRRYFPPGKSN